MLENDDERNVFKMEEEKTKLVIGRRETVDFPDLGLYGIVAKIDTGAYTTAIHCHEIREENNVLYFKLLEPTDPNYSETEHKFTDYSQKEIKNSFGEIENRYVIKTIIIMGRKRIKSVIALSNRDNMR